VRIRGIYKGMENNIAADQRRLEECKKEIEVSDVVITINGTSYGTIPRGETLSFTHLEILHAIKCRKVILPFFLDTRVLNLKESPDRFIKLLQLRAEIEDYCGPAIFHDLSSFMLALSASVMEWRQKFLEQHSDRRNGWPPTAKRESPQNTSPPSDPVRPAMASNIIQLTPAARKNYRESVYDRIAEWYDYWYTGHWKNDEPAITIGGLLKTYWPALPDRGKIKVLDCACGTGNPFVALSRYGYDAFGSDGSREMLRRAKGNCRGLGIDPERIASEPLNWTDVEGYRRHFDSGKLSAILNTGNSFCHLPPNEYMDTALSTFYELLAPGGLLIIDTKRFFAANPIDEIDLRELRFDGLTRKWIERKEREEAVEIPGLGTVRFHTRMFYDIDPEFETRTERAFVLLTICGSGRVAEAGFVPQTIAIPYYPLPVRMLNEKMQKAGFKPRIYPALEGEAQNWKYDIVVGQK
jgi:SAM-dependent methyltransferase